MRYERTEPFAIAERVAQQRGLELNFNDGERVTPAILFKKSLIKKDGGKIPLVKILSTGELTKKLDVKNCLVSTKAKEAIEKAGGKLI